MSYASRNFKTKKALKDAVKAGEKVYVKETSSFGNEVKGGRAFLEGPWFPQAHTWYAQVTVNEDGVITGVK
jgi:hypothetical protein